MKKLLLSVVLVLYSITALAEGSSVISYDLGDIVAPFEDNWITTQNGAELSVPTEWIRAESSDNAISGVIYEAAAGDMTISIAFSDNPAADAYELANGFLGAYDNVMVINVNGVEIASYTAPDNAYLCFAMLDEEGGVYTMTVAPGPGSAEFAETAAYVMSTLGVYSDEETVEE